MLLTSKVFYQSPVGSLRVGGQIGIAVSPLINPDNLKIEGAFVIENSSRNRLILLAQDIREISVQGFAINDQEVLSEPRELIRLTDLILLDFSLIGKLVETTGGERVGKVVDFAFDRDSLFIQKLYVGRSIVKSFSGGSLSIDRSQIYETTPNRIIINDLLKAETANLVAPA